MYWWKGFNTILIYLITKPYTEGWATKTGLGPIIGPNDNNNDNDNDNN